MSTAIQCYDPPLLPRRERMWTAADGRCHWCDCATLMIKTPAANQATMDHVIPRYKGGTNDDANVVLACAQCNNRRNHEDATGRPEGSLLGRYTLNVPTGIAIVATKAPSAYPKYAQSWTAQEEALRMRMQRDNALLEIRKQRERVGVLERDLGLARMLHEDALKQMANMTLRQFIAQQFRRWLEIEDNPSAQ